MNHATLFRPQALALAITLGLSALAGAGYGLYRLGVQQGQAAHGADSAASSKPASAKPAMDKTASTELKAGDVDPATGRKILYYHDPMVPGTKFDRPGKSPFMDMMLVPVLAGDGEDTGQLSISPRVQQNLGLRTAAVVQGTLSPQFSAVGSIAFNERDQAVVQARATGFVEKLHVRATLEPVRQGQPLAELYVPDWVAAQEEFLAVRRMQGPGLAPLLDAARARMRQLGMSDAQIALVEAGGKVQPRITLTAPIGGVAVEVLAREGMTLASGATLLRINGLSTVWAQAEVPEAQAALLRPGARVTASSPAVPGSVFEGRVQAILPEVNATTRTLKARLELANPGGRLLPGMFVTMAFAGPQAAPALLVPSDAVIQTGQRSVVMLAEDGGHFRPVQVQTGREAGGQTEVTRGLQAGQKVVVSAQFLIDSEASLRGLEARLNGGEAAGMAQPAASTPADPHAGHTMPAGAKP